jgi:thymidylate synthase (FAD)
VTNLTADAANLLERPHSDALDQVLGLKYPVLDHGFVRVIDYMGDEAAIVQAARVSYGKGTKTVSEDRGLLRYLLRHRHTTPLEMCEIKLHVKLPIFVARQWVRHRTANINEASARYSILSSEFYLPEGSMIQPQSTTNKQGRSGSYSEGDRSIIRDVIHEACLDSFKTYEAMVRNNVARELSRVVAPLGTYTEWYWKIDLHNLLHFLSLRADPHAQAEIRAYAAVILDLVQMWVPNVFEAFTDYVMDAVTFSSMEIAAIRNVFELLGKEMQMPFNGLRSIDGLSVREQAEFIAKLGLSA